MRIGFHSSTTVNVCEYEISITKDCKEPSMLVQNKELLL